MGGWVFGGSNWNCICVSINSMMMNNNEHKKNLICFKLKKWSKTKAKNISRKCFPHPRHQKVKKMKKSWGNEREEENIIKFLFPVLRAGFAIGKCIFARQTHLIPSYVKTCCCCCCRCQTNCLSKWIGKKWETYDCKMLRGIFWSAPTSPSNCLIVYIVNN